jgi:hypothetical protein
VKSVYIDNERAEVITEKLGGNTFLVVDKDFGEIHITGK